MWFTTNFPTGRFEPLKYTKHLKSAITAASLGWNERSTNSDTSRHDECNSKFNDVQSKHLWTQACDNVVSAVKRRRSVLAPKHLKLVSLFEVYKKCVCKISAETLSKDSPGVTCSRVRSTFVFCSFVTRTWLARNTNSTSQRQSLDALRQRCQTIPLKDRELVYNLSTHGDRCTSFATHHIWTSSPGLQPSTRSFSRMTHIDLGMEPTSSFWTCSWILISW